MEEKTVLWWIGWVFLPGIFLPWGCELTVRWPSRACDEEPEDLDRCDCGWGTSTNICWVFLPRQTNVVFRTAVFLVFLFHKAEQSSIFLVHACQQFLECVTSIISWHLPPKSNNGTFQLVFVEDCLSLKIRWYSWARTTPACSLTWEFIALLETVITLFVCCPTITTICILSSARSKKSGALSFHLSGITHQTNIGVPRPSVKTVQSGYDAVLPGQRDTLLICLICLCKVADVLSRCGRQWRSVLPFLQVQTRPHFLRSSTTPKAPPCSTRPSHMKFVVSAKTRYFQF